ncbi:hypothetical protein FRB99_002375 [Tulasnella sp. 403]|nr:hypothetical protein FRB99_002375 [Tulasnella sp. 403]
MAKDSVDPTSSITKPPPEQPSNTTVPDEAIPDFLQDNQDYYGFALPSKFTWEQQPLMGPADPTHTPYHKRLLLLGIVCPPVWWFGAWNDRDTDDPWNVTFRLRCQAMTVVTSICTVVLIALAIQNAVL